MRPSERTATFYFELAARWYVFLLLNIYGWGKIFGGQFYRNGHLPAPLSAKTLQQLSGFELAWTFFGYSYSYVLIIGITQIAGAALLLWDKTKLIGIAVLLPVLVNIIVVDACFGIPRGALLSASIYLSLLIAVLFINRGKVKAALAILLASTKEISSLKMRFVSMLVVLIMLAVFFLLEQLILNFAGR